MHLQWDGNDYLTRFKCLVGSAAQTLQTDLLCGCTTFLAIKALCCDHGLLEPDIGEHS